MPKFATSDIAAVKGRQQFQELVVIDQNVNADEQKGQLEIFREGLEAKYDSDYKRLLAIMTLVSEGTTVANKQFRDVTPSKEAVKEYEFKSGDLRVYAIKIFGGKLILLGGYKNQQQSDFSRFRSLKKQYLDSINDNLQK